MRQKKLIYSDEHCMVFFTSFSCYTIVDKRFRIKKSHFCKVKV